jgi:hypothetical protein
VLKGVVSVSVAGVIGVLDRALNVSDIYTKGRRNKEQTLL